MSSDLPWLLTPDALEEAARSAPDSRHFRAEVLRRLRTIMDFDWHVFALTDPVTGVGIDPLAKIPDVRDAARAIKLKYLTATNRWTTLNVAASLGDRAAQSPLWREIQAARGRRRRGIRRPPRARELLGVRRSLVPQRVPGRRGRHPARGGSGPHSGGADNSRAELSASGRPATGIRPFSGAGGRLVVGRGADGGCGTVASPAAADAGSADADPRRCLQRRRAAARP